jgi:glucose dehydrogenase
VVESADTVIIGSGVAGLLVARELLDAGEKVTIIERGPLRLDADSLPLSQREDRLPSTEHNTVPSPRKGGHPWLYGYAFGGSSLVWSGVAPRLLPSDFETRSRFGIWRDWPIGYEDLLPFYRRAEQALSVAGAPSDLFPGSDSYPIAPPVPSAADRLLGPLLEPFGPLPLARPAIDSEPFPPPLDGTLETTEPSFTMLEIARGLVGAPGFSVVDRTVAARFRTSGDRVTAVECIGADGTRSEIAPRRVVAAAHGIENAALLLRSGLDGPSVGRWLGAHTHVMLDIELDRAIDHSLADTRDSGISYAWADGEWRSERASAIVIPFNPGVLLWDSIVEALANGRRGAELRRELSERFAKTAVVYVSLEDAPRRDRFVELSSKRDKLGLPRSHVSYPPDSDYVERGLREVCQGLQQRLAPLGARIVGRHLGGRGGHMLGTCFMGPEGVVDENLRHHRINNLYIAGGSAFPTHSALHPTVTIAALAMRLGRHLTTCRA